MNELLRELDAQSKFLRKAAAEIAAAGHAGWGNTCLQAAEALDTHHAEIAEALKDAERWRALHWAESPMVTVTGSQLARGIRPGDFSVPWDWPVTSMTRIRMIVMNDSAREAGE